MGDSFRHRELFGGGLRCDLPERFMDISDFRPVPDHQEIFADAAKDQSIIVEIVERADVSDDEACAFFWADVIAGNEAQHASLVSSRLLNNTTELHSSWHERGATGALAYGELSVSKGRQGPDQANRVHIGLFILRLPAVDSDILVTVNTPIYINPASSSAEHARTTGEKEQETAQVLIQRILATLELVDWGLFG